MAGENKFIFRGEKVNLKDVIEKDFSSVISILQNGSKLFEGEHGFADKANEVANRINTKFGTVSVGKVFVATVY